MKGATKEQRVLQHEYNIYLLHTGRKVHFERLKLHNNGPTKWDALAADGEIAVMVDREREQSVEDIPNLSEPSYRENYHYHRDDATGWTQDFTVNSLRELGRL